MKAGIRIEPDTDVFVVQYVVNDISVKRNRLISTDATSKMSAKYGSGILDLGEFDNLYLLPTARHLYRIGWSGDGLAFIGGQDLASFLSSSPGDFVALIEPNVGVSEGVKINIQGELDHIIFGPQWVALKFGDEPYYLCRLKIDGDLLCYKVNIQGVDYYQAESICPFDDSSFIVSNYLELSGGGVANSIAKYDNGVVFSKKYTGLNTDYVIYVARNIAQISGTLFGGGAAVNNKPVISKFNINTGDLLSSNLIENVYSSEVWFMADNVVVVGLSSGSQNIYDSDIIVARLDADLSPIFAKKYVMPKDADALLLVEGARLIGDKLYVLIELSGSPDKYWLLDIDWETGDFEGALLIEPMPMVELITPSVTEFNGKMAIFAYASTYKYIPDVGTLLKTAPTMIEFKNGINGFVSDYLKATMIEPSNVTVEDVSLSITNVTSYVQVDDLNCSIERDDAFTTSPMKVLMGHLEVE